MHDCVRFFDIKSRLTWKSYDKFLSDFTNISPIVDFVNEAGCCRSEKLRLGTKLQVRPTCTSHPVTTTLCRNGVSV